MLVASVVEFGGECQAVAALRPQVIGHIQTAIGGGGTIRRASGIAVEVAVGDPVCEGDIVEAAADGRVGICFVDDTVFNLCDGACVELSEFVSESDGTSHSALFVLTRGTFAFIAGRLAKTGSLRVDTPFGTIRGRAHSGGLGMLSLAALIFSTMKEVHAADPNVTFLDDDSVTYKDLAHGAFELITKEAVPRHIIVEDPEETVVLSRRGSSISVNQVGNTPTRMEELQAAQQDVLANYAKGLGPSGSSTPPFVQPQPLLQPINFNQPIGPAGQEFLQPLQWVDVRVPESLIVAPPPPTLNAATGPLELDTVVFDTFAATSGTFAASSSVSNATLTFGISGGTAGTAVLDEVAYNMSSTGAYGVLYLNGTSGAYTFVPNSGAINALTAPTTESFVITVSDGALSASQTFTIVINGTNDAAIISGTAAGTVVEAGVASAIPGTLTASGTLTDADVDNTPNTFTAVSSPTKSAGGYGTFTMTAAGVWTYTPDNTNSAVQALNTGDTLTDSFTVTTIDGTAKVVTITINGSNDAAIISGAATGSVVEAGGASLGAPSASGTLTDADVDNAPNTFTAVSSPTKSAGGYGTFTMTAAGAWVYTLDNASKTVQALNTGDTLTDSFTVTTIDGTPQVVTITINGSNDAAVISGTTTGSVIEAGGVANLRPGMPTATGTLTDTDLDNPFNSFTPVSSPEVSAGGYGTFTMTAAGVWVYTLDNANKTVQALNVCNTLTDSFTVTSIDGTPQVVKIIIQGSNDAAVISGTATGSVVEAGGVANATPGTPTASGTLTDADVDNTFNTFTAVSWPTKSAGGYGTFTMTAAGVWVYKLDNASKTVQALNTGDTLTDSFTVTTIDGTPQVVKITIQGSNDAAVISGSATGSVVEAGAASRGTPTACGTLTDSDVDNTPNTFMAVSSPTESDGGYGTFTMTAAGVWTYTLDNNNSAVDALDVGDRLTDSFTVHTIDGTTEVVTICIHGAGDADPNDFDNLAVGKVVTSDPPFVHGTPGSDSIAGGGDTSQIIYGGAGNDTLNGTGVDDAIYGGSGNDTIKGNGGCDTIYGGSGSDTINGNNGDDTIIGGFGADRLTGSHGDDVFAYLSVADSRAGRFDTITDFASESDKIDLTALGALGLAILALAPTSTSVPAHTIAWLYDSAANETIVYVNPTDQSLGIGASGLLEIHLQGIATIESEDFILAPATATTVVAAGDLVDLATTTQTDAMIVTATAADVSSDTTVSNGALFADLNRTAQTTGASDSFDVVRDHKDPTDHTKLASFHEGGTPSTEDMVVDAVITLPRGLSIELPQVAVVAPNQTSLAFGQMPAVNNADVIAIGHGEKNSDRILPPESNSRASSDTGLKNEDHGLSVPKDTSAMNEANTHAHTIDTGSNGVHETGMPKQSHNGTGNHSISRDAGEHGASGVHDIEPFSIAHEVFGRPASKPGSEASFHFKDEISTPKGPGVINAELDHTPGSNGHHENATGTHGPHGIAEVAQTIELSFPEQHSAHPFNIVATHEGHAVVTHVQHDLIV